MHTKKHFDSIRQILPKCVHSGTIKFGDLYLGAVSEREKILVEFARFSKNSEIRQEFQSESFSSELFGQSDLNSQTRSPM